MEEVENGDDKAQLQLGLAYYNGDGVKQNYREVYHWFSKAIEQRIDRVFNINHS